VTAAARVCSEVARGQPARPWVALLGVWQGMRCLNTVAGRQDSPGQGHRPWGGVAGNGPFPAALLQDGAEPPRGARLTNVNTSAMESGSSTKLGVRFRPVDHWLHPGPPAAAGRRGGPAACAASAHCLEFVQRTACQASGAAGGATRGGGQGRRAGARERKPPQGAGGRRGAPANWWGRRGRPARPSSQSGSRPAISRSTRTRRARPGAGPTSGQGRGRGRAGRCAFGSLAASRPCPAGPTAGEYGGRAMRLRLGRARLLGGLVGAWQPGQGR
jgi:hypothetical protein